MEPDEIEIHKVKDDLVKDAAFLSAKYRGDKDECRVSVPTWVWEQVLTDKERLEELIYGWFVVEHDDELDPDNAVVSYQQEGRILSTMNSELAPPALEVMGNATQSA